MLFSDYFKGMIKYEIKSQNPESLINDLRKKASPKSIRIDRDRTVSFLCYCNENELVEESVHKYGCEIVNKREIGFVRIRNSLKRRIGLIIGFSVSIVLVFASTFFVWDIRVIGNENLTVVQIIDMLDDAGFREGVLKRNVNVKSIVNRVLINEDELSWLAINFEGTVANVEVKEASIPKKHEKKENVNIVASHNGIIMRVDALDGSSQVIAGDVVYKGQLLISSFVDKRTGGSILKGARGFVWAKTVRSYCVSVPLEYFEKEYTGNESISYSLSFLGREADLFFLGKNKYQNSCAEIKELNMSLSRDLVLPIEAQSFAVKEYRPYKKRRTEKDALEIAKKTAKEKLFSSSPDFKCAGTQETYSLEEDRLVYFCSFEGVENIAQELEFELS